jgi:hypothetical protein
VKIILNQQQAKAKKYYYLDSDHLSGFTILLKIATLKCEPTYTAIFCFQPEIREYSKG